jgi:hypothetical protein
MSKTPMRIKWVSANVGEDNEYIFKKYSLKTKEGKKEPDAP